MMCIVDKSTYFIILWKKQTFFLNVEKINFFNSNKKNIEI